VLLITTNILLCKLNKINGFVFVGTTDKGFCWRVKKSRRIFTMNTNEDFTMPCQLLTILSLFMDFGEVLLLGE